MFLFLFQEESEGEDYEGDGGEESEDDLEEEEDDDDEGMPKIIYLRLWARTNHLVSGITDSTPRGKKRKLDDWTAAEKDGDLHEGKLELQIWDDDDECQNRGSGRMKALMSRC